MEKNINTEIDKLLNDCPVRVVQLIKASLDTTNVAKKLISRKTLVRLGKSILPQMYILLESEELPLRMEAAKIIELVANRTSIPVLIGLLEDTEFDIRWIAAEGLIKIGRRTIRPVLRAVRDGENSIFLNEGAHHVLNSLLNDKEKKKEMSLLQSLENIHSLGLTAPVEAAKSLGPITANNKLL
jgi:hypothetical protein